MIRLEPRFTNSLLALPESGMGYQLVTVERTDGITSDAIAYNAELVLYESESRMQLGERVYEKLLRSAQTSEGRIRAIALRLETRSAQSVMEKSATAKSGGEAKNSRVEKTKPGDVFKRFSAYANDRRLKPDGSLVPGTYATTAEDANHVKTGSDAVRRYALPDPKPASFVFTSRPQPKTDVQCGTVAPAFGQPGGGVEVIFPTGTQPGTTTGPAKIPD
jgi:hypothetical protein